MSTTYPTDEELFFKQYEIVCKKCGGKGVTMCVEPIEHYGEETGASGGYITFGCPDCKKNDFHLSV